MANKTVIAELCQNHNGEESLLDELVSAAADSGADYVKMQYVVSKSLSHRERFDNGLFEGGKTKVIKRPYLEESQRLKKLDLPEKSYTLFLELCDKYAVKPMITVFTLDSVDHVLNMGYKNIKLSSFDCISKPLIEKLANSNIDKLILSTGCSYRREIEDAAEILNKHSNPTLLHCVSIYPTPIYQSHLSRINYLRGLTNTVGISDHSNPEEAYNIIPAASSLIGANTIEKHFTILPKDQTKDGPVSVNPEQLKELSFLFKASEDDQKSYLESKKVNLEDLMGDYKRELSDIELLNRDYYQGRYINYTNNNVSFYNWDDSINYE